MANVVIQHVSGTISTDGELLPENSCRGLRTPCQITGSGVFTLTNTGEPDLSVLDEDTQTIKYVAQPSPDVFILNNLDVIAVVKNGQRKENIEFDTPLMVGV